ncbi:MAG: aldehyde dehydrogenase family protein [Planctomycetota bacterium]
MKGPSLLDTKQKAANLQLRLHTVDHDSDTSSRVAADHKPADVVRSQCHAAQRARTAWAAVPLKRRLTILKNLRLKIAENPRAMARLVDRENEAETLAAEVLPLLDACRFLETEASRILRENPVGRRGRPMWLWGNSVVLRPEPLGVVLIIGPSNYPLMLPGIQALQAVASGNVVLIKPAANCSQSMQALVSMAVDAGLPEGVIQLLPESPEAAVEAIHCGVNKVFLTGSANTGRAVSRVLAESATPAVMELSGCDAVFVLDDADLNLVCDCLLFGLTLNKSQTCMAPRRVFAKHHQVDEILRRLTVKLTARAGGRDLTNNDSTRAAGFAATTIREAMSDGAELVLGSLTQTSPSEFSGVAILDHVTADMSIAQADIFAPVLSLIRVESSEQSLQENLKCPYALSAAVFGSSARCQQFARRIPAGCIVINDIIVPTADPRVPFGGRGMSGYGMTRGAAGLLEMTQLKAIVTTRRWFKPHLHSPTAADSAVMEQLIRLEHAAHPLQSLLAVPGMIRATIKQQKIRRNERRE